MQMGNMSKYTIPAVPPSINKFIGRDCKWEYQAQKKEYAELIAYTCVPKPKEPFENVEVHIHYFFKDNRGRDLDNYQKFVLDGLVKAKIIKDDCWQCVTVTTGADVDKINPRTEIEIKEIKQ